MTFEDDRLRGMFDSGAGEPGANCLSDEDLASIASGGSPVEEPLEHIVDCDWCGERLRILLEVSRQEAPVEIPKARRNTWRYAAIAAGIVVAVGGSITWWFLHQPDRVASKLLAESYTERREFDWRLPDQGWARRNLQRGTTLSAPLIRAEALLIASDEPLSARRLDLRARAEMLNFRTDNVENAAQLLEQAIRLDASAPILTDYAVACALRAELEGHASDYAAAVEYTTRALQADPKYAKARFNRALAYERLGMTDQAVADWEKFLQVETDAGWLAEARGKLQELRERQNRRGELRKNADGSEAALDRAAVGWLVSDRARARSAGETFAKQYGDSWLRDAAAEAVDSSTLLSVLDASVSGNASAVIAAYSTAGQKFSRAPAHEARLRLERVYALNRLTESQACLAEAARLIADLSNSGYHWIRITAQMYRSACAGMAGDQGAAIRGYEEAIGEARRYGMDGLELRGTGRLTSARLNAGNWWAAWEDNRRAMERLEQSPYSITLAQQCLTNYSTSAEQLGWFAASMVFMDAAADALRETPNRITEAADRSRAASMALAAGFSGEARRQAGEAETMFGALPDSEQRKRYLDSTHLLEAEAQLKAGRPKDALALAPVRDDNLASREKWRLHQVIGRSLYLTGRIPEARKHLEAAVEEGQRRASSQHGLADHAVARREGFEVYRTLAEILVDQAEPARALDVWLTAHGSDHAPDLVYLALEDGYAVWGPSSFARIRVNRAKLRQSIERFVSAGQDPATKIEEIKRQGRALFDQVLAPVAGSVRGGGTLTVLPDADIAELPFALLVDADNRWLGEERAVAIAPGAEQHAWNRPALGLIAGNPASADEVAALPEFLSEAEALRSFAADAVVLDRASATSQEVLRRLPEVDVFHYAGHGYASSEQAGIYLTDQPLTAAAVRGLHLDRHPLIVLSACMTAWGESRGLANNKSLVRAFLDAGAGAVIASRWPVDSAATAELMKNFYLELPRAADVAQALAGAETALRDHSNFKQPYYWAGFDLYQ